MEEAQTNATLTHNLQTEISALTGEEPNHYCVIRGTDVQTASQLCKRVLAHLLSQYKYDRARNLNHWRRA